MKKIFTIISMIVALGVSAWAQEEVTKTIRITGDPDAYTVGYQDRDLFPNEEGVVEFTAQAYDMFLVDIVPGYRIQHLWWDNYGEISDLYSDHSVNSCRVYTNAFADNVVTDLSLETEYIGTDMKFNGWIVGDPTAVMIRKSSTGEMLNLTNEAQSIPYDGFSSYDIMAATGRSIYQVEVNGSVLPCIMENYWSYTPQDGDELVVRAAFPDGTTQVSFTFGGECEADVIASVWVAGTQQLTWNPSFEAPLGSVVQLYFDTTSYTGLECTVNGEYVNLNDCRFTLREASGYAVEITGDKQETYLVEVETNIPGSFKLKKGWSDVEYDFDTTASAFTIKVSPDNNAVNVHALTDYIVGSVCIDGEQYGNPAYITGDCKLYIEMSSLERDKQGLLWLDPSLEPTYCALILSNSNWSMRSELAYPDGLQHGYNEFKYADFDCPLSIGLYPSGSVWLNDDKLAYEYGQYIGLENYAEGDLLRILDPMTRPVILTYDIDADCPVEVKHDRIRAVDTPSEHQVYPGTEFSIRHSEGKDLTVTVDGNALASDENGLYTYVVTGAHTVKVTESTSAAETIGAQAAVKAIYTIEGIRVNTSDVRSLPAGLYIIDGKKVAL